MKDKVSMSLSPIIFYGNLKAFSIVKRHRKKFEQGLETEDPKSQLHLQTSGFKIKIYNCRKI